MNRRQVQQRKREKATRRDQKSLLDHQVLNVMNVTIIGIDAEREALRKRLRISEWRKLR